MIQTRAILTTLVLSTLSAFTVAPTASLALGADGYKDRISQAASDLPRTILESRGVPGPILDVFFGSSGGAEPIDYAKIAQIVAE